MGDQQLRDVGMWLCRRAPGPAQMDTISSMEGVGAPPLAPERARKDQLVGLFHAKTVPFQIPVGIIVGQLVDLFSCALTVPGVEFPAIYTRLLDGDHGVEGLSLPTCPVIGRLDWSPGSLDRKRVVLLLRGDEVDMLGEMAEVKRRLHAQARDLGGARHDQHELLDALDVAEPLNECAIVRRLQRVGTRQHQECGAVRALVVTCLLYTSPS